MSQYYYWLIPDEPHRTKLQQIILRFSKVYQSPIFTPHITIGTGNRIPNSIPNILVPKIRFISTETEHTYFRSLYFKCATSNELTSLWNFFEGKGELIPHLSLIYGDFSESRERDWCANTPPYLPTISFSSIWIVRGSKQVQEWQKVESFSL